MLEWNIKHFPLNLQSGLTLSNFRDVGGGFELRNQIRHWKTVCIKRNLHLINYNPMRTQWTTKGYRDAGSSCLCDRGLHRYLRNFGGWFEHPKHPPSAGHCTKEQVRQCTHYVLLLSLIFEPITPVCLSNFCIKTRDEYKISFHGNARMSSILYCSARPQRYET